MIPTSTRRGHWQQQGSGPAARVRLERREHSRRGGACVGCGRAEGQLPGHPQTVSAAAGGRLQRWWRRAHCHQRSEKGGGGGGGGLTRHISYSVFFNVGKN